MECVLECSVSLAFSNLENRLAIDSLAIFLACNLNLLAVHICLIEVGNYRSCCLQCGVLTLCHSALLLAVDRENVKHVCCCGLEVRECEGCFCALCAFSCNLCCVRSSFYFLLVDVLV